MELISKLIIYFKIELLNNLEFVIWSIKYELIRISNLEIN